MTAPDSKPPTRFTGWQIAMIAIGSILLLPGLCSLFFMIGMASEFRWSDPISQMIATLWGFCLLVAAGGIVLICAARKGTKGRRDQTSA